MLGIAAGAGGEVGVVKVESANRESVPKIALVREERAFGGPELFPGGVLEELGDVGGDCCGGLEFFEELLGKLGWGRLERVVERAGCKEAAGAGGLSC